MHEISTLRKEIRKMKRNTVPHTALLLIASVASGLPAMAASPATPDPVASIRLEDWKVSNEASDLLRDIHLSSSELTRTTGTLATFVGRGYSIYSHASHLSLAKQHINTIGDRLQRLGAIRHEAAPWQQDAIDSILPSALTLAESAAAAIEHLKERPNHLWSPEYTGHLRSMADHAVKVKGSVGLHLDLASAQVKLESLRTTLAESRS